jgi:sugar phosphate isomerase/epimerase
MNEHNAGRRTFLAQAAGLAAGAVAARLDAAETPSSGATRALRLGAPVGVAGDDPEALARAHRELGYRAAYCPDVALSDTTRIRTLRDAFARHDVVLAEVGRWVNLLASDSDERRRNRERVSEGLALAEALGARCCVDIAGSFNASSWFGPHPDNLSSRFFDAAVENARAIVDAVKPQRAVFCYEMMAWSLPDSPDAALALIRAVDRKGFGVHLDAANLVNSPARFYQFGALVDECYEKLAPWLASVHVKDLTWDVEMSLHFREVVAGTGALDLARLLRQHARATPEVPLLLEHLASPAEYDQARRHLFGLAPQAGVTFD